MLGCTSNLRLHAAQLGSDQLRGKGNGRFRVPSTAFYCCEEELHMEIWLVPRPMLQVGASHPN